MEDEREESSGHADAGMERDDAIHARTEQTTSFDNAAPSDSLSTSSTVNTSSPSVPYGGHSIASVSLLEATPVVDDETIHMQITIQEDLPDEVYDGVVVQDEDEDEDEDGAGEEDDDGNEDGDGDVDDLTPWWKRNRKLFVTGLVLFASVVVATTIAGVILFQRSGEENGTNPQESISESTPRPMQTTSLSPPAPPNNFPPDESLSPTKQQSLSPSLPPSLPRVRWKQRGREINGEASEDLFGISVALAADAMTMAVGAQAYDGNGTDSGAVYIYNYDADSTTWVESQRIDGEASDDRGGKSVAIAADGKTVAVGAYLNDKNGKDSGNVRIYRLEMDSDMPAWMQLGQSIGGESAYDWSAYNIALSADGTTLAVGSRRNDSNGRNSGAAGIYRWDGDDWFQLGQIIYGSKARFFTGYSVALSDDAMVVAIGSPLGDDGNDNYGGYVTAYRWDGQSTDWVRLGQRIHGEYAYGHTGTSLALNSDGSILAIGSHESNTDSGHVQAYKWNGATSEWMKMGEAIVGEADYVTSGWSISISSDGMTLAVGAPYLNNDNEGDSNASAHVYQYDSDSSTWRKLGGAINGHAIDDLTGYSVSITSDGKTLAVGAPYSGVNGYRSGNVRVFNIDE
eukprot:CAMPEP_0183742924 /NCGR_PEP_ID=MMETSP0737-20130205/64950_1 /TAXON_ID=385413 /ORGANISM="Thalassiosira miniscula, Strain CCMP1093" /LENGTH=625 /DNA_ID=CAMNT_0025978523 /DNA_START=169 /DNA_END=2046 /DNA_ORIENTATION=+